jgi:hypothetical protein
VAGPLPAPASEDQTWLVGDAAEVRDLPLGRLLLIDGRGRGLRGSWHLDRGLVNLSVWREDRCVETFHLSVADAGRLAAFLVECLGEAAVVGGRGVAPPRSSGRRVGRRGGGGGAALARALRTGRAHLATWIAP